ncbi:SNF2-like protein, partial [Candidatus Magnetomorum sp. HK-1]
EAKALLSNTNNHSQLLLHGWLAYLTGNGDQAIEYFQMAFKSTDSQANEIVRVSIFFCLAELLRRDNNYSFEQSDNIIRLARKINNPDWFSKILELFEIAIRCRLNPDYKPSFYFPIRSFDYFYFKHKDRSAIVQLFSALGAIWFKSDNFDYSTIYNLFKKANSSGYLWFAGELAKILLHSKLKLTPNEKKELTNTISNAGHKGLKIFLFDAFNMQVNWQRVMDKLLEIKPYKQPSQSKPKKIKTSSSRLVWILSIKKGRCSLKPKEQKQSNNGKWSKGRPVALKRLKEEAVNMGFISPQDAKICSDISVDSYYSSRYLQTDYSLNSNNAIKKLVDHPYVFMEDAPTVPVEIVNMAPELRIVKTDNTLNVSIYPITDGHQDTFVEQESPSRINLYLFDQNQQNIAINLQQAVAVPLSEKKKIHQLINKLSGLVTIHSDIDDFKGTTAEVSADKTPHIHLQHYGNGLKVLLRVRPFKDQGPYYKPGVGGKTVIAAVKRKNIQTNRDLQSEQKIAKSLVTNCPTLAETENGTWEWLFDDNEQALNLLLELEELRDKAVIEWPEGQPITLSKPISINAMKFSIRKKTDWFETTGELLIDDEMTLSFRKLLDLIEISPGRFIPLDNNRFLVLKDQFRRQLEAFNTYSEKTRQGAKIHWLAALSLGDFSKGAESVSADKHWRSHLKRLEEGLNYQPEVHSTFQGELRSYQIEGVQWLMRLAFWQVGACLADDMGLGKTIQALAVMLSCAHEGPILVVAPSSVTFNWLRESRRFAPTLNPKLLTGKNRKQLMENLQPFDLLITSYTLLVMESDRLKKVSWRVVLLDEAQAIKNAETKRSQAAMNLMAKFKMITTGTPIENHLGELWNLFRFINPGLLG